MVLAADNSSAIQTTAVNSDDLANRVFQGFQPLDANYVYCPNQFFDICLKSNSRGMVRIVAYILRQTLGWFDENGQPINQTVKVSYRDLIEKAGVSRGAIRPAIQRAEAIGFIKCCVQPTPNVKSKSSQTAEYTLRWDHNLAYANSFESFSGFFAGEGNRTAIPNSFFDDVIPNESLAVCKVVGAVIRHTIGYQNQFGQRMTEAVLSYTQLQKYVALRDRSTMAKAIRRAIDVGYVQILSKGNFSNDPRTRCATTYAIRWFTKAKNQNSGSKIRPTATTETKRFKNPTRNSSKSRPAQRFKNPTSIKKTNTKENLKQQTDVVDDFSKEVFSNTVLRLIEVGFKRETARQLVESRGVDVVDRQLSWIKFRDVRKSKTGLLRKAIEEDWSEPEMSRVKTKQRELRERQKHDLLEKRNHESIASENRKYRLIRKRRLLEEWRTAPIEQRRKWIESAIAKEDSITLQNLLRRQKPNADSPHVQVLDRIALERSLPPVILRSKNDVRQNRELLKSLRNKNDSPQRKAVGTARFGKEDYDWE